MCTQRGMGQPNEKEKVLTVGCGDHAYSAGLILGSMSPKLTEFLKELQGATYVDSMRKALRLVSSLSTTF